MAKKSKMGKKAGKKMTAKSSTKKTAGKKMATKAPTMWKPAPADKTRSATRPKNGNTLSYTQTEFVENIRAFCGLPKRASAKEICEDIAYFVRDSLKKGYKIPLLGLGKLYVRQSKARMGRNPATGEPIHIAPKKRVRFTAAKALKEAVL